MIKNIFFPTHLGSYYLLSQRIVGLDIGRSEIHATIITANGNTRTIEKFVEQKVENNSNLTHEERIIASLKKLHDSLGKYDSIFVAFPSSSVIFKELSLPFTGLNKIKQVIPFEVESLLPFSLEQASLDVIITKEDQTHKTSDVLVATVKKDALAEFVHVLNEAGVNPDKITVDMFEIYGLYKSIPSYQHLNGTVAIIDLGLYVTRIAIIVNGQLKFVRSLPKGIVTIAKKISSNNGEDANEALDHLLRFGTEQNDNNKLQKNSIEFISELLQEINFTIHTITNKLKADDQLQHCIITGAGAEIPGINEQVSNVTGVKSEILQTNKIIYNGTIKSKVKTIPSSFLISLATSLALPITQEFNLQQKAQKERLEHLQSQQLITFAVLSALLLFAAATYSFFAIRNLKVSARQASQETQEELKRVFKLKESQVENLDDALKNANRTLEKQESTWRKLLSQNRYSMLNYLIQLTKCLNIKESRLTLNQIVIKQKTIELWGEVPSHDYLIKLQKQLSCPLFKNVPRIQDYDFTKKPITLTIDTDREF